MIGYAILFAVVFLAIGYLLGSVLTGVLIGKALGTDPRTVGSKGAGATNVSRTISTWAGFAVVILDAGKTMIAVAICYGLLNGPILQEVNADIPRWIIYLAGVGAVIGHCWPCFFKFKGGKGVACFGGLLLIANPPLAAIVFGIWLFAVIISEYVSLGSMLCSFIAIPLPFVFAINYYYLLDLANSLEIAIAMALMLLVVWALIVFQHRKNIQRIVKGDENRAKWAGKVRRLVSF